MSDEPSKKRKRVKEEKLEIKKGEFYEIDDLIKVYQDDLKWCENLKFFKIIKDWSDMLLGGTWIQIMTQKKSSKPEIKDCLSCSVASAQLERVFGEMSDYSRDPKRNRLSSTSALEYHQFATGARFKKVAKSYIDCPLQVEE
ncbi:unnamed protein product [Oikopleura dioica]|uniref:Uncharacterized protein n=1 Tax=Oikopleura dioica TaxID=34765 RepID=E4XMB9_OIKDI|nr:unnamed protein product [Oikopleura dioica]